jgi:hypothetical protein
MLVTGPSSTHQQLRTNIVSHVGIEGKTKSGMLGTKIEMYLRVHLAGYSVHSPDLCAPQLPIPDTTSPGTPIALLQGRDPQDPQIKIHPLNHDLVPYSFDESSNEKKKAPIVYIPTPDLTGLVDNYDELYLFNQDECDNVWLDKNNERACGRGYRCPRGHFLAVCPLPTQSQGWGKGARQLCTAGTTENQGCKHLSTSLAHHRQGVRQFCAEGACNTPCNETDVSGSQGASTKRPTSSLASSGPTKSILVRMERNTCRNMCFWVAGCLNQEATLVPSEQWPNHGLA